MSNRHGPPKHQNKFAWKPNVGCKINETKENSSSVMVLEVGGSFRPLSEITGVCHRCKEQIKWKRRYGNQSCTKRNVRQAYHSLCHGCAKEQGLCAKCCCRVGQTIGRDLSEVEAVQKTLDKAIKNARERDRRSLLRAMNKGKPKDSAKTTTERANKVWELFPSASFEEYAELSRDDDEDDEEERY